MQKCKLHLSDNCSCKFSTLQIHIFSGRLSYLPAKGLTTSYEMQNQHQNKGKRVIRIDIWKNKIMCPKFSLFVSLFQLLPLDGSILRRSTRLLHDSSSSNEIAHDGRGYKRFHSSSLWWVWFSRDSWGLHFFPSSDESSVSSSSGSGGSQDIDTEEEEEETLEQQQQPSLPSEAKYKVTIIRQSPVMDR